MAARSSSVEQAKSKFKKHRIINRTSVDESLFGSPSRLKQMTGNRTWYSDCTSETASHSPGKEQRKGASNETIQVITKDLIRKIKIPSTPDPSGFTVVLDNKEYNRIVQNSKVLTPSEKQQMEEAKKEAKTARLEASNSRKKEMQELELTRKRNEKPSDIEQESMEKNSELLARANAIMEEQDDEIKTLNETILNAKCHAIRDTQLKEKEEIKSSMEEENARLDLMMKIGCTKAIKDYEKHEKEIHLQRLKGAEVIKHQIKNREQQRLLDAEKKDQETQAMLRYLERLQEEDMENLTKKKQAQRELMEEVARCNEEIQHQKMQQMERAKLEDLKIMEYIKEKIRLEEEHKNEMERQKAEKEREIARLRAQQERAKDKMAERDSLRAKRRQEEFERDARKKEKEEAEKKRNTEKMLIESRQQQIQHKEHFLAMQATQDREEFERVLRVHHGLMEQEKRRAEEKAALAHEHALELRKQVQQKGEEKISARKAFFEEGILLDQEARERRRKLDEIKQRKLAELKAAGIPDKYCAEVSRRITAPPPSFTMSGLS